MLYSYETAFGDTFPILGDPGAVSRVDKMFVVKVYRKIILGDTGAVSRVDKIYRPDKLSLGLRGCTFPREDSNAEKRAPNSDWSLK